MNGDESDMERLMRLRKSNDLALGKRSFFGRCYASSLAIH